MMYGEPALRKPDVCEAINLICDMNFGGHHHTPSQPRGNIQHGFGGEGIFNPTQ
jgi:hypothetical protein